MAHTSVVANNSSIGLMEGCLTLVAIALAFGWPRIGAPFFSRIESLFGRLARRKALAVAVVAASTLLLRLAILPVCPIPLPFEPDDFSFLLAANTFAAGRLANPSPALWQHFETIHATVRPTYTSMYFPAQGLFMAAGKVLFGQPWFGILASGVLMCAAITWMLQAWLPPAWALLGGCLAILRLGLFSYWINTYTGAGLIAAAGGALVLGAFPRLRKNPSMGNGMLLSIGIVLLLITRPYEGLLLCLPVAISLILWMRAGSNVPSAAVLMKRAALPLLVLFAAGTWMGYYNYRSFGKATTLPYTLDRAQYATAPYFIWQSPKPAPVYNHPVLRKFYYEEEEIAFEKIHSLKGFVPSTLSKILVTFMFFAGFALWTPLFMLRRIFLDRRIRFLVIGVGILAAGLFIENFLIPHYLAPFTSAFYAIGLQMMRHLRVWRPEDRTIGLALVRLTISLCVVMAGIRLSAGPLHIRLAEWPPYKWLTVWFGPGHFGTARAAVADRLAAMPGRQLMIVRYAPDHYPFDEWVYNDPDIEHAKTIWAREMSPAQDQQLIQYYTGRQVLLVEPDLDPVKISPYAQVIAH